MRRRALIGISLAGAGVIAASGAALVALDGREHDLPEAPSPAADDAVFSTAAEPMPLPDLSFVDADDQPRSLVYFRGRKIVLNLWATWCVPCREEMPALDRLQARLGGPGLEVVALSIDKKGLPTVRAFYAELGLTALALYVDTTGGAAGELKAPGIPTTLLVDAQGREIGRAIGTKPWDAPAVVAEIERRAPQ